MKRILTLALSAAVLLGVAFAVHAEGGHGFHHDRGAFGSRMGDAEAFLAKALDLTDEQQAAVKKLHEELLAKAKPLMDQRRQQMEEIHDLLDAGNADATTIGQKVIAAHATGQELKALHEDFKARLTPLLNADQIEKLNKFKEMHREHGPFGFAPDTDR